MFFVHFLEYLLLFLYDNVHEESELFLNSKSLSLKALLSFCLIFCQFQPCVAYKSVANGKKSLNLRNKQQDEVNLVLSICKDKTFAIA